MSAVKSFYIDPPSHHHHRQKNLTPALSTLLSSTTIPCSRNKQRHSATHRVRTPDSFGFHKTPTTSCDNNNSKQPSLNFTKKAVSGPLKQRSRIRNGLGRSSSSSNSAAAHNEKSKLPLALNPAFSSSLNSGLLRTAATNTQNFQGSKSYPIDVDRLEPEDDSGTIRIHPIQRAALSKGTRTTADHNLFPLDVAESVSGSTPFWQLDEEDPEQDDDGLSAASSFSSISSSLSSPNEFSCVLSASYSGPSVVKISRKLLKRRSMSILASGHRVVSPCLEYSTVDEQSHPLADETEDAPLEEPSAKKPFSFMSQFTASIKAFTSAASSLSMSHQSLLSSSDVFQFSPRSTDEPIPRCNGRSLSLSAPPVRRSKMRNMSSTALKDSTVPQAQTAPTAVPQAKKPKVIALETYSVQEFALPPPPRQRDIRENPDFLRIYAIESVMRKNGTLASDAPGKAQVALLPRLDEVPKPSRYSRFPKYQPTMVLVDGQHQIPVRWVGISASDDIEDC